MNKPISQSPDYTYTEVLELLEAISKADVARLIQAYSLCGCDTRAGMSANEVLAEVAQKVLAGERAWPRSEKTLPYFLETGRSVISNEEKKYGRVDTTEPGQIEIDGVASDRPESLHEGTKVSPETHLAHSQKQSILSEWIVKIQQLFADDVDATCFMEKKLAEMKKAAILVACKFTDQGYRTTEKRIKDKIRKRFPKGFPWWEIE